MEAYWSFRAEQTGRSLVLPDGRCDIIFRYNLHNTELPTPIITGPGTLPFTVEYDVGDCWVGLRLRPVNAVVLWKEDISSAKDAVLLGRDASAVLPALVKLSRKDLTYDNLAALINSSESSLSDQRLLKALDALHVSGGQIRIAKMAEFLGCTTRQLNRLFNSNTGITTKTYAQLVQFHRTLKLLQHEQLSISCAAFEGGYADQAHLARAFQRFGGFTPSSVPPDLSIPALFA